MKERSLHNLNYNICYFFFLPALLYHSLHCNDLITNLLLILSLLSFTSIAAPQQHKSILKFISLTAFTDLVLKLFIIFKVIPPAENVVLDIRIVNNIISFGHEALHYESLVYLLVVGLSWAMTFMYEV